VLRGLVEERGDALGFDDDDRGARVCGRGEVVGHGGVQARLAPQHDDVRPIGEPAGAVVAQRVIAFDRADIDRRKELDERGAARRIAADDQKPLDPRPGARRDESFRRGRVSVGVCYLSVSIDLAIAPRKSLFVFVFASRCRRSSVPSI
jgi:hypothetical protein